MNIRPLASVRYRLSWPRPYRRHLRVALVLSLMAFVAWGGFTFRAAGASASIPPGHEAVATAHVDLGAKGFVPVQIHGDPLVVLRDADRELRRMITRRVPDWSPEAAVQRSRVIDQLGRLVDYPDIGRQTLDIWNQLTIRQRDEFLRTFAALTDRRLMSSWGGLIRTGRIHYESETIVGPEARVLATARPATADPTGLASRRGLPIPTPIEYRLHWRGHAWLVHDLVIDGVGLVATTRDQLSRLLRHESFDALLDTLSRRLAGEEQSDSND